MPIDNPPEEDPASEPDDSTHHIDDTLDSVSPEDLESTKIDPAMEATPSLLDGPNIDATINPRELSPPEVESWNQATLDSQTLHDSVFPSNEDDLDGTIQFDPSAKTTPKVTVRRSRNKTVHSSSKNRRQDKTPPVPAIDKTLRDRGVDQLRICEVSHGLPDTKSDDARDSADRSAPDSDLGIADQDRGSDYRVIEKLGQGGMGDVFRAEQLSLGRLLAIKVMRPIESDRRRRLEQTGRLEEVESERQLQFLTEARVTGDLDHPNIVPIHDVALTSDGELFYSMKQVVGTPWSKTIMKYSLSRNLEVLLRVCDAIAFAHTRGVVHRDIKPENIMLGDFGVVLVMDWGLALPTSLYSNDLNRSSLATTGLGGTPAFMAPEMAKGPLEEIGTASDVYLLGATLYLVVTGHSPHYASSVTECLKRVKENVIRKAPPEYHGELLDISLKAMQTNPGDRYSSVLGFQAAIREYQKHAGSIDQSREAFTLLNEAKESDAYETFSKASFKFEEAIGSWSDNQDAKRGLIETKGQHAEAAFAKSDLDLARSLLDDKNPEYDSLRDRIDQGISTRDSRIGRLRLLRFATAAMLLFIVVGSLVASLIINQKRKAALVAQAKASQSAIDERTARDLAENSRLFAEVKQQEAEQQRRLAQQREVEAITAKKNALDQKTMAERARDDATHANRIAQQARANAEEAKRKESYESHLSIINLAKARLEDNDVAGAKQVLAPLRGTKRAKGWEFRWLWRQVRDDQKSVDVGSEIVDASFSHDGTIAVILSANGVIKKFVRNGDEARETEINIASSSKESQPTAVAVTADGKTIVVGESDGEVVWVTDQETRRIPVHQGAINDIKILGSRVISGGQDRSVRVLDLLTQKVSQPAWHLAPIRKIAIQRAGHSRKGDCMIAVVENTETAGRITVWRASSTADQTSLNPVGSFEGHQRPASAVAIRDDGELIVSGDIVGDLLIWKTDQLKPVDFSKVIERALTQQETTSKRTHKFIRLTDPGLSKTDMLIAVPTTAKEYPGRAHSDAIESIDFSRSGDALVSGSRDFTMKTWDLGKRGAVDVFRGHGGSVRRTQFLHAKGGKKDPEENTIASASSDGRLRMWDANVNVKDSIEHDLNVKHPKGFAKSAHELGITSAVFSPDGSRVLTSSADHTAKVFSLDPTTFAFEHSLSLKETTLDEGTPYVAMNMQSDIAGKFLFLGSADSSVRIWDRRRGVELARVSGTGLNQSMSVSDDGKWLLTGSSREDEQVILWQIESDRKEGQRLRVIKRRTFKGHDQVITAIAVSNDGKRIFTGDSIGYGLLWDAETGSRLGKPVETVRGFRLNAASFASDGKSLWLAADDDQLTQLDLNTRLPLTRLAHEGVVKQFSFSHDESVVMTLSEKRTQQKRRTFATVWDVATHQKSVLERSTAGSDSDRSGTRITAVGLSRNGRSAMVVHQKSERNNRTQSVLQVWRSHSSSSPSETGWSIKPVRRLQLPHRIGTTNSVICSVDGQCSTMNDHAVYRWDLKDGRLIKSYRAHSIVTHADFSDDGRYVFTSSRGVKVWDAATGETLVKLEQPHLGPTWCIASVSASDESVRFVTGGDDGLVKLWNYSPQNRTVAMVRSWAHGRKQPVRCVTVDPTRRLLLFGGDRATVAIAKIDQEDNTVIPLVMEDALDSFDSFSSRFLCGSFSQDSKIVALGADDKRVYLWDVSSLDDAGSQPPLVTFLDHSDQVLDLKLRGSVDQGLRGISVSADDSIRVWDPMIQMSDGRVHASQSTARQWLMLKKHSRDVTAIDFANGGDLMMTSGKDGKIYLWPATNE